jgi:hypothetical protein
MVFLYLYSNVKLRYSPSNTSVAFAIGFMNGQVEEDVDEVTPSTLPDL